MVYEKRVLFVNYIINRLSIERVILQDYFINILLPKELRLCYKIKKVRFFLTFFIYRNFNYGFSELYIIVISVGVKTLSKNLRSSICPFKIPP